MTHSLSKVLTWILLAIALAYLLLKTVFLQQDAIDFKYFWLAGHIWSMGDNPYSQTFWDLGEEMFVGTNRPRTFFYPPNWWAIAVPFSAVDYGLSSVFWRLLSGLMVVAGCAVALSAHHNRVQTLSPLIWAATVAFASLMTATAVNLALGQTSAVVFLATACFLAGFLKDHRPLMILALVLLTLKPTVGILFWVFLVAFPRWWPTMAISTGIVLVLCLPAFVTSGPVTVLVSYLKGLGAHGSLAPNAPPNMTGLRNLTYTLTGAELSVLLLTALGCMVFIALALRFRAAPETESRDRALLIGTLLACLSVISPLHVYDSTLLALLIPLAFTLPPTGRLIALTALAAAFRPNNLATVLSFGNGGGLLTGAGILSLSTIVLAVVFGAALLRNHRFLVSN